VIVTRSARHADVSLGRGLVFAAFPGRNASPIVGTGQATRVGSATFNGRTRLGFAAESFSQTADGCYYRCPGWSRVTRDFTVAVWAALDSSPMNGKRLCIPITNIAADWNSPFTSLGFSSGTTTTDVQLEYATTPGGRQSNILAGFWLFDGLIHQYVATRVAGTGANTGVVRFYRDGRLIGSLTGRNSDPLTAVTTTATDPSPLVHLMVRKYSSTGEGTDGRIFAAALWGRAVTASGVREMVNPAALRQPLPLTIDAEDFDPAVGHSFDNTLLRM
jgi:hypothetical protein